MQHKTRESRIPIRNLGISLIGVLIIFISIDFVEMFPEGWEEGTKIIRNLIVLFGVWTVGVGVILARNAESVTLETSQLRIWILVMVSIWVILTASTMAKAILQDSETAQALLRLGFLALGFIILGFTASKSMSTGLQSFVARRLVFMVFVLLGVSVITFTLARVIPSNPAAAWLGGHPTGEQIAAMHEALGLNKPLPIQYLTYMRDILLGDWGKSITSHQPVAKDLARFLPRSLELVTLGLTISLLVGVPIGAMSAARKNSPLDHVSRGVSMTGVSLPSYFLGLLLQVFFFVVLDWLPIGGRMSDAVKYGSPIIHVTGFDLLDSVITRNWTAFIDLLKHMILPAVTLAYGSLAQVTRMTRSTMLDVLGQDYIRTARASGLSERTVIFGYALKNAIVPTLTIVGLSFGYMLAGTFLVELVFNYPGMGFYAVQAIRSIDYPAIMGVTILVATFYVIINLGIDVIQAFLDPRVKLQ